MTKDELKATNIAIEKVHAICSSGKKGESELSSELTMVYQCIRYGEENVNKGGGRTHYSLKSLHWVRGGGGTESKRQTESDIDR